jgi:hypothetical protein
MGRGSMTLEKLTKMSEDFQIVMKWKRVDEVHFAIEEEAIMEFFERTKWALIEYTRMIPGVRGDYTN